MQLRPELLLRSRCRGCALASLGGLKCELENVEARAVVADLSACVSLTSCVEMCTDVFLLWRGCGRSMWALPRGAFGVSGGVWLLFGTLHGRIRGFRKTSLETWWPDTHAKVCKGGIETCG